MKRLLTILSLLPLLLHAQLPDFSRALHHVPAAPSLTLTPTTTSGLGSVTGSLGTAITYTISWSAWTGNVVTVTDTTGFSISPDGSTWTITSYTFTPSGASGSKTLSAALASGNTAGSYTGRIKHAATGATTVYESLAGTTTGLAAPDSVRFQFDSTAAFNVSGWTAVTGDASKRVISGTVAGTSVTYTTVSTSTNNWNPDGALTCVLPNDGTTGATIPYAGSTGVMKESWFTWNDTTSTYPQFTVTGLNPANTYDIEMSGTLLGSYDLNSLTYFNVRGSTLQTWSAGFVAAVNGGASNTSTKATWSSVTAGSGGTFNFYVGTSAGNQLSCMSYIIVRKH